jgi:hypothetical protein
MIRLVAAIPHTGEIDEAVAWLSIEGDDEHGYLVRSFRDLGQPQLYDDWTDTLEAALDYGEPYGVSRGDWSPRDDPLPGGLPFPDMGAWVPDNRAWQHGGRDPS